ncbi:zinc finger, CCHC-type containing protein [Tanacetum coccineum]
MFEVWPDLVTSKGLAVCKKNNANVGGSEKGFGYYNNGMFMLNLNKVPDDSDSVYMSSSTVVNSTLWHARLGHVHYKRMLEMSKDDLIPAIDENLEKCQLHAKDEVLDKFRIYKTEVELQQNDLIKTLRSIKRMVQQYVSLVFFSNLSALILPHCQLLTPTTANMDSGDRPPRSSSVNGSIPFEGSKDQVGSQYSYCYSIEEDPRTYNEAMQSRDAALWKEAIDDEIGSIMENNT